MGGILLTAIAFLSCVSLLGRNTIGLTLAGDFELTGAVAGAAIALFLPWCQVKKGHIIVDFFTSRASTALQHQLDRLACLLVALSLALIAWRTAVGGLNAWNSGSGSQILGFPDWIVYACIAPPLALAALIGLCQTFGFAPTKDEA